MKIVAEAKKNALGSSFGQFFNVPVENFKVYRMEPNEEYHSLLKHLYWFKYYEYNIGYIMHEPKTNSLVLFDNGDYDVSKLAVKKVQDEVRSDPQPGLIFSTHSHFDVWEGNTKWKEALPDIEIFSGNFKELNVPGVTVKLDELDTIKIGTVWDSHFVNNSLGDFEITCMFTPGHSNDHVAYLVFDKTLDGSKSPIVFTGNAVFNAGWGACYNSLPHNLFFSFLKIMNLPRHTRLFPSGDYTYENLVFGLEHFPGNQSILNELKTVLKNKDSGIPNVGFTVRKEMKLNPFNLIQQKGNVDVWPLPRPWWRTALSER